MLSTKIPKFVFIISFILFAKIDTLKACEIEFDPEIQIVNVNDRTTGRDFTYLFSNSPTTLKRLASSPLKNFVLATTQRVLPQIAQISECGADVKIFFVYPDFLFDRLAPKLPYRLFSTKTAGTRYLDSPWVKYEISSSPRPFFHVAFMWDRRQFLLDQALMSGLRHSTPEIPQFDNTDFMLASVQYLESIPFQRNLPITSDQEDILKKLPIDLNWLFRNTRQDSVRPFDKDAFFRVGLVTQIVAKEYINLTASVFDQALASQKTDISYKTIFDLKDVFDTFKYRINDLNDLILKNPGVLKPLNFYF